MKNYIISHLRENCLYIVEWIYSRMDIGEWIYRRMDI